jgi:hypothetical protein
MARVGNQIDAGMMFARDALDKGALSTSNSA